MKPADVGAGGVGEVLAHHPAASWRVPAGKRDDFELSRMRATSQALAASTTTSRVDPLLAPSRLVDVEHTVGTPLRVERHLPRHGAGDEREPSGRQCRQDQHVGRGEVGVHRAAAAALAAVVAARSAVVRPGEDRKPGGNAGDLEPVRRLLDQQLLAARLRWRQEDAIGMIVQPLVAAEDADQPIDLVVPRLDVVVGDGPVVTQAVDGSCR